MNGGPRFKVSSATPTATLHSGRARHRRGRVARREPVAMKRVEVQLPCNHRPEGQDRRLAGSTSTATPLHRRIHDLVAISAKFFMIGNKKTLELASSTEEKHDVNPTSTLGPLLTCMRQENQVICRTR